MLSSHTVDNVLSKAGKEGNGNPIAFPSLEVLVMCYVFLYIRNHE